MAGVVAMASVIEDFDTQPCRKPCKDVDSPVVKTIKNYFSPVVKPAEKPFSPPRSNNIMDYFNRKGPSPKNRVQSPSQAKENCQTGKQATPPVVPKQPAQKRSRKTSKAARKLVETAEDCIVLEETDKMTRTCGVLGSDTAIFLGQICAEASASSTTSDANSVESDLLKETMLLKNNALNSIDLSPILPPKDKPKRAKTSTRTSRTSRKLEDELSEPEIKEVEKSLGDTSMEVNVGDGSQLNNSTVTISFEDFVRSQVVSNSELCEEIESVTDDDQSQITNTEEKQLSESCLEVSPRMVTIQAEVHAISPKEKTKNAGKIASIFNMEKVSGSIQEVSAQTESSFQTASKRKSNVVILEEDVELCVLESSSTPKCSQAERKQFMAAFKQPSIDGTKTKPSKNQGKPKQGDKTADATDKVTEDNPEIQSVSVLEEATNASQEDGKEVKKKPSRKRLKRATIKQDTTSNPAPASGNNTEVIDVEMEDEPTACAPPVPTVRRSKRAAVTRQTSTITVTESPPKSTSTHDSSVDVNASNQQSVVSTPKKHKSKHGVFKAEMLCPPDDKESPIRIRFRRINACRNKYQTEATPLASKNIKDSKNTKQAKKLLEKAKALKQNKKASTEEKGLRRSSRSETSIKRSYCEDEDTLICLEDCQETNSKPVPEKSKSKKALRSLNDVLGKAAPNKEIGEGSRLCQDKAPQKPIPVSIFDDSSQEGSENSQDDEQFRARKEFLKSGLPESFKKQMAKTAAAKEAYATSCSSFQPVKHVFQAPKDCSLWNLPWPRSAFVNHLKGVCFQFSDINFKNDDLLNWKTQPVHRYLFEKISGCRPNISTGVREELIKEISGSNPSFPVQKYINIFLKKRADLIQQCPSSALSLDSPTEASGRKRKRAEDENKIIKAAKKQRSSRSGENLSRAPAEEVPAKREGRSRRAAKSVSKGGEITTPSHSAAPVSDKAVIVLDDSPGPQTVKPDVLEDMQWTEKYQPQHSSEVMGNKASVKRLHSWLKEWKLRADKEDKKKQKDQKRDDGNIDSDWECEEEDSQDAEDMLCNTMLITGPTGVGKTAAVYACAQELGFKVFEVNASSQRSGRLILSQLKEATQSHQVDSQGVNAHKPTYFNSYSTSAGRPGSSPRKVNSPRRAVSSPRKLPQSPRGTKRGGLAPTSLANFFKISKPAKKEKPNTEEQTAISKKKTINVNSKKTAIKLPDYAFSKGSPPEELSKKTATSLILFEEVDVIFDEDLGFLSAIKTFMMTTKRPVILTTSDTAFSAMFDGNFEEIIFETPSVVDVASYLQLLCLAEGIRTDLKDISALLSLNSCDVRKTLLQLQYWTRSGGGQHASTTPTNSSHNESLQQKRDGAVAVLTDSEMKDPDPLPVCDTGCTESMLGLLSIAPHRNIWELLKKQEEDCSKLVIMSRQQGVDLFYSNMEALLPLPLTTLTISNHKRRQLPSALDQPSEIPAQSQKLTSYVKQLQTEEDFSDDASPVKVSSRMKRNRKRHCPSDQGVLQSDSDSEDGFLSIKQQSTSQVKETVSLVPPKVMKKPLSREELVKSVPVSQCLRSLADFMDDMSFVDLLRHEDCNVKDTSSAALVKDGLTDEARIDTERRSRPWLECASEIDAQVQSLSFTKCRTSVDDAWHKVQLLDGKPKEEAVAQLTLPVVSHNEVYTFTQHGLCQPQVVKQRSKVMDDLEVNGVFGSMVNRAAAAQDYLPALRTICKSELLKEQGKVKRRFLHYLDAVHLGLQKSTLEHLAEDFP